MKIYQVWDFDPMASAMGDVYLAKTFRDKADAEAEVEKRNAAWRADFEEHAANGKYRASTEPWNWQHASITESELS